MVSELWSRAISVLPPAHILILMSLPHSGNLVWVKCRISPPHSSWMPHTFPLQRPHTLFPWQHQENHSKLIREGGKENHWPQQSSLLPPCTRHWEKSGREPSWPHYLGGTEGTGSTNSVETSLHEPWAPFMSDESCCSSNTCDMAVWVPSCAGKCQEICGSQQAQLSSLLRSSKSAWPAILWQTHVRLLPGEGGAETCTCELK